MMMTMIGIIMRIIIIVIILIMCKLLRGTVFTFRGFAVRRELEGDSCDLLEDTVLTSADVCKS
jgi:hypothetical protein